MDEKYKVNLISPPDREKLTAEILFGDTQWAELNQENVELRVEFYPRPDGRAWNISLADVEAALKLARQRLVG